MNSAHWPGVINNGHTTGKSIGGSNADLARWPTVVISALSVVVNAQADALTPSGERLASGQDG